MNRPMSKSKPPVLGSRHRLLHPPDGGIAVVSGVQSKWINLAWEHGGVSSWPRKDFERDFEEVEPDE